VLIALPAPGVAQTAPEPLSPIAQAAAQRGVRTCLSSVEALSRDLSARYDVGVFLFNRVEEADSNVLSISMELEPSPSGGTFYLSASFAPSPGGRCQIIIETTVPWNSGCVAVGLAYPGYQVTGPLLKSIRTLAATGPERLFLLPTGPSSCISIEKTVHF
jgi:hypothetical protein